MPRFYLGITFLIGLIEYPAPNAVTTTYGPQVSFTTNIILPEVTTAEVTEITLTAAKSGGEVIHNGGVPLIARGVVWSTSPNPTLDNASTFDGTDVGIFESNLTDLTAGVTYYIRAYAANSLGTAYGNEVSFVAGQPILTTAPATNITTTTATSGGNITSDNGAAVTVRGVVWSTSENPTLEEKEGLTEDGDGMGEFVSQLTGLSLNTKYYVKAYAINEYGTAYGTQQTLTTLGPPTVTTTEVTNIAGSTAQSGGTIASDGGAAVTARGVVWGTSEIPTLDDKLGFTEDGAGTDPWVSSLTGLLPSTTYYIRAYATNSVGTGYGNQVTYTTNSDGTIGSVEYQGYTYSTVLINGVEWFAENLRTTMYNDETDIPHITDDATWAGLTTPAYSWYGNDEATYGGTYGVLYNWYAVNTSKLCPTGWHVPTDAEWYAMENYVDPTINNPSATSWRGTDGGTKLKSTSGWNSGGNGTDIYGFSALPGGYRDYGNGTFGDVGDYCNWWSRSENDVTTAWRRTIYFDYGFVRRNFLDTNYGLSVRCVKD